jgi:tetratricopeptide (TPR) repeat protein
MAIQQKDKNYFFSRGNDAMELHDYQGAAAEFEAGLKLDPENAVLISSLEQANKLQASQQLPECQASVKQLEVQGKYYEIAQKYYEDGDYWSALELYTKALNFTSESIPLYYMRGLSRFQLLDYEGAIEDFKFALTLDMKNTALIFMLGQAYLGINDSKAAYQTFLKGLNIEPSNEQFKSLVQQLKK